MKKIEVNDFCLKKFVIFVDLGPFSGESFKICSKWPFYPEIIIFEKVKKFQNSSMILWEMASDLLKYGHIRPPLHSSGLNFFSTNLLTPAATLASHLGESPAQYPNPANNTINEMQYNIVAPAVNTNSWNKIRLLHNMKIH